MSVLDVVAGVVLLAASVMASLLVPAAVWSQYGEPTWAAVTGFLGTLVLLVVFRARRAARAERWLLAIFLAAMPLIYLRGWLQHGQGGSIGWLWVELGGFALYGALAVLGLRRSPWYLVAGIAAHGLFWDLWHLRRTPYIPDWYAIACAVIDVGLAVYAASRIPSWRSSRQP